MSDLSDEELASIVASLGGLTALANGRSETARMIAELQRRRAEQAALEARVVDVANEQFGPFPVQTADEALTAIERGCFAARQEIERRRAEQAAGREHVERVVREAYADAHRAVARPSDWDMGKLVAVRVANRLSSPVPTTPSTPGPGVMDVHAVTNQLSPAPKEQPRGMAYIDRLRAREQAAALAKVLSAEDVALLQYLVGWCNASVGDVTVERDRFEAAVAALDRLIAGAKP